MSSVVLKGLSKKYENGTVAVSNFNADISSNEFFVILGPSGCGKSTLIRMIAGLEDITSGSILIDNTSIKSIPPKNRGIALVLNNQTLYPNMTVYENLEFGLKMRKIPKDEIARRIEEVAQLLDIGSLLDRKPAALSGGQRYLISFGRAIIRDPKVILMDEPLINFDAKLRASIRQELKAYHARLGKTIIYVTKDQAEAAELGSRILVMRNGTVQQTGTYEQLYESPVNVFVAKFIGEPQMNICEAELFARDGIFHLRFGQGFTIALPEIAENSGLKRYSGKKLLMGIRPTDVLLECEGGEGAGIPMTVENSELLGTQVVLSLVGGGVALTAQSSCSAKVKAGEEVRIHISAEKLHLFDSDTERRIN